MKKFKVILRSIGIFLLCTMCMVLSACGGGWDLDEDEIEDSELENYQLGVILDNVKILRRSYGDDKATTAAKDNGYYDKFIKDIVQYLSSFYGVLNTAYDEDVYSNVYAELFDAMDDAKVIEVGEQTKNVFLQLKNAYEGVSPSGEILKGNDSDNLKYFYDAIRYQITEVIPYYYDGDSYTTTPTGEIAYYYVTADTSAGWNWGTAYDLGGASTYISNYATNTTIAGAPSITIGSLVGTNKLLKANVSNNDSLTGVGVGEDFSYGDVENYGVSTYYTNNAVYEIAGLSPFNSSTYNSALVNPTDLDANKDAQTQFEQALAYVVYSIVINDTPKQIQVTKSTDGNTFTVAGYTTETKPDGTVITSVQKALEAAKAKYMEKGAYVGLTKSDQEVLTKYILNNVIGQNALNQSKKVGTMQNLYYEEIVSAVVAYCSTLTNTGTTSDGSTTIGGQYMSSEIVDYEYNSAFVNSQKEGFAEFEHLGREGVSEYGDYEYQSMLLEPTDDSKIDEIWIDFGYFGDGIGINDTITIRTYVRCYLGGGNFKIISKDITVKENSIDVGEDGTTLLFRASEYSSDFPEGYFKCDAIDFGSPINSTSYNKRENGERPIGNDDTIVIGPARQAKSYYSLVEGTYRDYGVYNHEKLKGTEYYDKCYVEVAFEVIEASCDNYKFCCGFSMCTELIEIDWSKWQ